MSTDLRAKFEANYIPEPNSGCWLWTGRLTEKGYGELNRIPKSLGRVRAHRVSYQMHNGEIPVGLFVIHSCDTPACVNPGHLSLGTNQDNMDDMVERDRSTRGVRNPANRLTPAEVLAIRADRRPQSAIAERYGVSNQHVSRIKSGQKWGWLKAA